MIVGTIRADREAVIELEVVGLAQKVKIEAVIVSRYVLASWEACNTGRDNTWECNNCRFALETLLNQQQYLSIHIS